MGRGRARSDAGQALPEYTLIVAGIAIGCLFAILVYTSIVNGLFDSTAKPLNPAPFVPPVTTPQLTYPTSIDECLDGGWQNFPQFRDEQACFDYIASLGP